MSTGTKNNKALIFLIVILLLSNVALLLYFFVFKKPVQKQAQQKNEFSFVDMMKKEIGFNDEQTKQFQQLHEMNRDSLKAIGDSIRSSKNNLYKLLQQPTPTNDSTVKTMVQTISMYQQRMETRMFRHFERVRGICTPEQQIKLDSMVARMNNRPSGYRRNGGQHKDAEKK